MTRYYVRREGCWGGTYVYAPWDSTTRKKAGPFSSERTAQRRVDRLNADWENYQRRRWSEYATAGVVKVEPIPFALTDDLFTTETTA